MAEFYSPDNLKAILPYLPREPKWLVLGGPGDAREAQTARELWPDIKIIGIEPNPEAHAWQLAHGWPKDCVLLPCALSDELWGVKSLVLETGRLRNASIDPEAVGSNEGNPACTFRTVNTLTIDYLDSKFVFEDAIVWLDIEGSELRALQGAEKLIASGRVMLFNVEMLSRVPGLMEGIPRLLKGYRAVKDWNDSPTCRDRIFVKE